MHEHEFCLLEILFSERTFAKIFCGNILACGTHESGLFTGDVFENTWEDILWEWTCMWNAWYEKWTPCWSFSEKLTFKHVHNGWLIICFDKKGEGISESLAFKSVFTMFSVWSSVFINTKSSISFKLERKWKLKWTSNYRWDPTETFSLPCSISVYIFLAFVFFVIVLDVASIASWCEWHNTMSSFVRTSCDALSTFLTFLRKAQHCHDIAMEGHVFAIANHKTFCWIPLHFLYIFPSVLQQLFFILYLLFCPPAPFHFRRNFRHRLSTSAILYTCFYLI